MGNAALLSVIVLYLFLLFFIAYWVEKNKKTTWLKGSWVYALSLTVYTSAWTYYGSVGVAATSGLDFLPIYLGPVIAFPLWVLVMRKTLRISKLHKVSSVADFLSLRYGQNRFLGALVASILVIGVVPYIALQLKAISETFRIMTAQTDYPVSNVFVDATFYIAILLAVFAAIYGTQTIDASEKHKGIVVSTAIESIIKLVFFLIIGIYVTFYLFDGTHDMYARMSKLPDFEKLITLEGSETGYSWMFGIAMSFFAIFLLPRQFQVAVVENNNERHLKRAIWVFPLYLLLFNLFTVYIAWGGRLTFGNNVDADYFALLLPLSKGNIAMALLVFVGGLSAVVSMVIISTLALSTMVSNNIIIPYGFLKKFIKEASATNIVYIKMIRRISIFLIIVASYIFYLNFSISVSLVSIGLLSFVAVSQLAPAFFLGLYWNRGTSAGAISGIILGFAVTIYTYFLPFVIETFTGGSSSFVENGPFGISILKPYALFGLDFLTPSAHAFFWGMFANLSAYLVLSLIFSGDYRERNFAELFVNSNELTASDDNGFVWKGEAYVQDIENLLARFLGHDTAQNELNAFFKRHGLPETTTMADARLVNYSKMLLAGSIGSASANILISSVTKEERISLSEVLKILEESKNNIARNRSLQEKSRELLDISKKLKEANNELILNDKQKNDFLDTVAHELKTPLSGIRAATEILIDEDTTEEERQQFLSIILNDSDRLSRLINNILDFEKMSSGKQKMVFERNEIKLTIEKSIASVKQLAISKNIWIQKKQLPSIVFEYDEDRIIQVITNLLSNAIKFSNPKAGKITVDCCINDKQVEIMVENNGKTIHPEDFKFIFDKFYQSHEQTTKKPTGSGLGLAICKQIIENHNGQIWADENCTEGALFTFSLPLKQPDINKYET